MGHYCLRPDVLSFWNTGGRAPREVALWEINQKTPACGNFYPPTDLYSQIASIVSGGLGRGIWGPGLGHVPQLCKFQGKLWGWEGGSLLVSTERCHAPWVGSNAFTNWCVCVCMRARTILLFQQPGYVSLCSLPKTARQAISSSHLCVLRDLNFYSVTLKTLCSFQI